jgi:drug/metabolite transporter (DMT)-like permease
MTDNQRVDGRLELSEVNLARGAVLVVLAVAGFSLSGAFVRHVPGLTGWQINCWRGLAMAAILVLYLILAYGLREAWQRFRAVPIPAMIACAGFFSVGSTLYVTALTLTSTANVSAVGATSPLFTALLSPYITGEKPSLLTWAAALAALFGVGVIVHGGLVGGHVTGNLVSLLVALSFAGQTLSLRRFRHVELCRPWQSAALSSSWRQRPLAMASPSPRAKSPFSPSWDRCSSAFPSCCWPAVPARYAP